MSKLQSGNSFTREFARFKGLEVSSVTSQLYEDFRRV